MTLWQQEPTTALYERDSTLAQGYRARDSAETAATTLGAIHRDSVETMAEEAAARATQAQQQLQSSLNDDLEQRARAAAASAQQAATSLAVPEVRQRSEDQAAAFEEQGMQPPGTGASVNATRQQYGTASMPNPDAVIRPANRVDLAQVASANGPGARVLPQPLQDWGVQQAGRNEAAKLHTEQQMVDLSHGAMTPEEAQRLREQADVVALGAETAGPAAAARFGRAGLRTVAAAPEESAAALRRALAGPAVVHDADALAQGRGVAATRSVEDWLALPPDKALTQAEQLALRATAADSRKALDEAVGALQNADVAGAVTPAMQAQVGAKALEAMALDAVQRGQAANAGRTLRSFQTALAEGQGSQTKAVRAAFNAIGTNEQQFGEWVSKYALLPADDAVAKVKMLQALQPQSGLMDKALALYTNSLLSNPASLAVIGGHGTAMTLFRPIYTAIHDDPRDALVDLGYMARATGQAWSRAVEAFTTGVSPSQAARALESGDLAGIRPDVFPGKAGMLATPTLRFSGALHEFAKTISTAGALAVDAARQARTSGQPFEEVFANATPEMLAKAQAAGEAAARGTVDPLTRLVLAARALTRSDNPAERAVGLGAYALAPFTRIPMYLTVTGAKVGVAPVTYGARALRNVARGQLGAAGGDLRVASLAAAFDAWAGYQVLNGTITGNAPLTPGTPRESVRIAGHWTPTSKVAGPLTLPVTAIASAIETAQRDAQQPAPKVAKDVASAVMKVLLEASALRTAGHLIAAVEAGRGADELGQFGASTAFGLVPFSGALNAIATAQQPGQKAPENPWQAIEQHVPGLRQQVPDYVPRFDGSTTPLQDRQVADAIARVRAAFKAGRNPDPRDMAIYDRAVGTETQGYRDQQRQRAATRRYV